MTTIKLRRGLSTAFSTNNPVLAVGEPAFATDTGVLKIGDGTTAYNSLPSIGASPDLSNYVQKTDYASTSAAGVIKVDGSTVTINADGVISSAGSVPSNMVTTDTQQTISGIKTWKGQQFINGGVEFGYTYTNRSRGSFNFGVGSINQPNACISPNGYIDLTGHGNNMTNTIRLDYYTAGALTIRRQVERGTIDNGVFNVWSGNTAAASSTRFKVDNTGVTVNGSKVLTESTGALADFSNTTNQAKILMGSMAMPSGKYIELTLGASGSTYIAPANGYYRCYIGGQSGYKQLKLETSGGYVQEAGFTTSNHIFSTVPIQKGQKLNVQYSGTLTTRGLRFIYAQGSESEVQ